MLVDDELLAWHGARWVAAGDLLALPVPATITTLLAARLEGLPGDERALLALASVEGTLFHRSAIPELAPECAGGLARAQSRGARPPRRDPARPLDLRRRRGVPLPASPDPRCRLPLALEGEAGRPARAAAAWLERTPPDRLVESEEIVGYHLEQAYRCRLELGLARRRAEGLGARASRAARDGRAQGARARRPARGDRPARARRVALPPTTAAARGAAARARRRADRGRQAPGRRLGARRGEAGRGRARATSAPRRTCSSSCSSCGCCRSTEGGQRGSRAGRRSASSPIFERYDDHHGLCSARRLEAWLHWNEARAAAAAEAWEQAAAHASAAPATSTRAPRSSPGSPRRCGSGPRRSLEGIRRCEEIRARSAATSTPRR